jgi:hypothetical protein
MALVDRNGRPQGYDQQAQGGRAPSSNSQAPAGRNAPQPNAQAPRGNISVNQSQLQTMQTPRQQRGGEVMQYQSDPSQIRYATAQTQTPPGVQTATAQQAPAAPAGPYANHPAYQQVAAAYKQHLGRDATYSEVMSHLGNGNAMQSQNIQHAIANISNSPEAQAYQARAAAGPGPQPGQPQNNVGQAPAPHYDPYQFKWGQTPDAYKAGTLDQFTAPDQSQLTGQSQALLSQMLANPHTLNDRTISGMQEGQKEAHLQMMNDQLGNATRSFAARGLGSLNPAMMMGAKQGMIEGLTKSYRDIDMMRAATNRQDELGALGASDAFMNNQLGRAQTGYQTRLGGQMAQEQLNQAQFGSQMDLANLLDRRQLAQAGEHSNAFNTNEGVRQFNSGMGFNYAQLANNNQNALIRALLGI